jgi:hypothetical protein
MNTKDQGSFGVLVVMQAAMKKGYTVCTPYGDNQRYDLLLDKRGVLKRVQVKCMTPKNGRIVLSLFTVMHNKDNRSTQYRRVNYTAREVDALAIVNAETNEVYMIPVQEIDGLTGLNLRTDKAALRKSNKARYAVNYLNW